MARFATLLAILGLATSVLGVTPSSGCGKTPTYTEGNKNMMVNGKNRQYIVRLPQNYANDHPYRLIFGLHWLDSNYQSVDGGTAPYYGMKAKAENSAIFVAPDGLNRGWGNQGGEDVTFISNIVEEITNAMCVDLDLIFTMGFSYGGAMSFSLACSKPDIFRAVAVLSGATLSGCQGGTQPVAYYGQHGIRDGVLNISMGRQLRDRFVANNGCTATNPQEPGRNSRQHIKTEYTGCKEGYPVTWVAFDEDHVALPQDSGGDGGPNSWTIGEVWDFFSQFE
ncbi:related to esterase D [Cephalotrichum gorgonifer]|uniref:Feruloyl esterase C n=1 Tax=Cephalotrichum gorgonifer TaxID=2041049 RepID=A0AAE8SXW0_9PEZI|nr:related to esterase D [Cephalotrichum gorgonifer]